MDQLKKVGLWLKQQHFWVLVVIAVLVALGCWWRGASTLLAEYKTNRGMIDSGFTSADGVANKTKHANDKVQEAQAAEIAKQQEAVSALWQQLYDRQTAGVLKWPSNLSKEFHNHINKLKFGDDIPTNLRSHYNNYIRDHFPELPKIVGALEQPDTGQSGGMGRGMGGGGGANIQSILDQVRGGVGTGGRGGEGGAGELMQDQDFMVIWADQQLVRDELYPSRTPSSKRIWKTQEDLWVYEALLHIIANTNKAKGSDRFSTAAIRVIESLEVGRTAAQASRGKGRIDIVETAPVGGEMGMEGGMGMGMEMGMEGGGRGMEGGMGMGGEMGMGMGMEGGGYGREGAMAGSADTELFNNRYVGADGAPIPDAGGDQSAFGVEFKRLPVRMRLWMDQRWLPQLISECASAPLQVEIQEVRINVADDAGGGGGGGRGGMGGGFGRGGEGGYGMGAMAGEAMTPEQEPNMKSVVLQGTVYIFNPPSEGAPAAGDVAAMPQ
jgi:hypothetical protein